MRIFNFLKKEKKKKNVENKAALSNNGQSINNQNQTNSKINTTFKDNELENQLTQYQHQNSYNHHQNPSFIVEDKNKNHSFFLKLPEFELNPITGILDKCAIDMKLDITNREIKYSNFLLSFKEIFLETETSTITHNGKETKSKLIINFGLEDKIRHWVILSQIINQQDLKEIFNALCKENEQINQDLFNVSLNGIIKYFNKTILIKNTHQKENINDDLQFSNSENCIFVLKQIFKQIVQNIYSNLKIGPYSDNMKPLISNYYQDKTSQNSSDLIKSMNTRIAFDISLYLIIHCFKSTDDIFEEFYQDCKNNKNEKFAYLLIGIKKLYIKEGFIEENCNFNEYILNIFENRYYENYSKITTKLDNQTNLQSSLNNSINSVSDYGDDECSDISNIEDMQNTGITILNEEEVIKHIKENEAHAETSPSTTILPNFVTNLFSKN